MAVNKVGAFAPGDVNFNNIMKWVNYNAYGRDRVSLTNWTTGGRPQVAKGSFIEIGGSLYEVTSDEAISGTPSDGYVYILAKVTGESLSFEFTTSVSAWDSAKFGYYSGNNKMLLFRMTKSGSSFSGKNQFDPDRRFNNMNLVETQTWESGVVTLGNNVNEIFDAVFTFSSEVKGIASIQSVNKAFHTPTDLRRLWAVLANHPFHQKTDGTNIISPDSVVKPIEIIGNTVKVKTLRFTDSAGAGDIRISIHLTVFI